MIVYDKALWGVKVLFRVYGSPFPRAIPFALASAFAALAIELFAADEAHSWWLHPYPYQVFSFIVGFILVFRSNSAYQRFWEGRTTIQIMSSKWADALTQLLVFDSTSPDHVSEFEIEILHLVSLLHAISLQRLRRDMDLDNLVLHDSSVEAPTTDATRLEGWRKKHPFSNIFVLQTSNHHKNAYFRWQKLPVIGGLLQEESVLLQNSVWERPSIVLSWVQTATFNRSRNGGLQVPPPILTRVYQELSNGMLGFEQGRKIADTPFPFISSQMALVLLVLHMLSVPLLMAAWIDETWLVFLMAFLSVWTYWTLNEVARDLEDPFLHDPNELPFPALQHSFNTRLISVLGYGVTPYSRISESRYKWTRNTKDGAEQNARVFLEIQKTNIDSVALEEEYKKNSASLRVDGTGRFSMDGSSFHEEAKSVD